VRQEKTHNLNQLRLKDGYTTLDLLDLMAADSALAAKISSLSPAALFDFLTPRASTSRVLIVSGLEVVLATWPAASPSMKQFAARLELWEKKPALVFVIQREPTLEKHTFTRYPQYRFVMDQTQTIVFT
jgi:hypothetical protein